MPEPQVREEWKQWEDLTRQTARQHGLDEELFFRQIYYESSLNPKAKSYAGAEGIAQLMPSVYPEVDRFDPHKALPAAATTMVENLTRYKGDWRKAVAAYTMGWPTLNKVIKARGDQWEKHIATDVREHLDKITLGTAPVGARAPAVLPPTGEPTEEQGFPPGVVRRWEREARDWERRAEGARANVESIGQQAAQLSAERTTIIDEIIGKVRRNLGITRWEALTDSDYMTRREREAELKVSMADALSTERRSQWYMLLYSELPIAIQAGHINSFEEMLEAYPLDDMTDTDRAAAKALYDEYVSYISGQEGISTEEAIRIFKRRMERPRPRPIGVGDRPSAEIVKYLRTPARTKPIEEEGITEDDLLAFATEIGRSPEDVRAMIEMEDQMLPRREKWREYNKNITDAKAGTVDWKFPRPTWWMQGLMIGATVLEKIYGPIQRYITAPAVGQLMIHREQTMGLVGKEALYGRRLTVKDEARRAAGTIRGHIPLTPIYREKLEEGLGPYMAAGEAYEEWAETVLRIPERLIFETLHDPLTAIDLFLGGLRMMGKASKAAKVAQAWDFFFSLPFKPITVPLGKLMKRLPRSVTQKMLTFGEQTTKSMNRALGVDGEYLGGVSSAVLRRHADEWIDIARRTPGDLANPKVVAGLAVLAHEPIGMARIASLRDNIDGKWAREISDPIQLVERINDIVEDTVGLVRPKRYSVDEGIDFILMRLDAEDTMFNRDTVRSWMKVFEDNVVSSAKAPFRPANTFDQILNVHKRAMAISKAITTHQITTRRLKGGMVAKMGDVVDASVLAIWQKYIDRHVVSNFAQANLVFALIGPGNLMEDTGMAVAFGGWSAVGTPHDAIKRNLMARAGMTGGPPVTNLLFENVGLKVQDLPEGLSRYGLKVGEQPAIAVIKEMRETAIRAFVNRDRESVRKLWTLSKRVMWSGDPRPGFSKLTAPPLLKLLFRDSFDEMGARVRANFDSKYLINEYQRTPGNIWDDMVRAVDNALPPPQAGDYLYAKKFRDIQDDMLYRAFAGPDFLRNMQRDWTQEAVDGQMVSDMLKRYPGLNEYGLADDLMEAVESGRLAQDGVEAIINEQFDNVSLQFVHSPERMKETMLDFLNELGASSPEDIHQLGRLLGTLTELRQHHTIRAQAVWNELEQGGLLHVIGSARERPRYYSEINRRMIDAQQAVLEEHHRVLGGLRGQLDTGAGPFTDLAEDTIDQMRAYLDMEEKLFRFRAEKLNTIKVNRQTRIDDLRRRIRTGQLKGEDAVGAAWFNSTELTALEWDAYRIEIRDPKLRTDAAASRIQRTLSPEDIDHIPLVDVSDGPLTFAHIAHLYNTSPDQLTSTLLDPTMASSKDNFVDKVILRAREIDRVHGKDSAKLGWTRKAIGEVYDSAIVSLISDATLDGPLTPVRLQLASLQQDIIRYQMAGVGGTQVYDIVGRSSNQVADDLLGITKAVDISDIKPRFGGGLDQGARDAQQQALSSLPPRLRKLVDPSDVRRVVLSTAIEGEGGRYIPRDRLIAFESLAEAKNPDTVLHEWVHVAVDKWRDKDAIARWVRTLPHWTPEDLEKVARSGLGYHMLAVEDFTKHITQYILNPEAVPAARRALFDEILGDVIRPQTGYGSKYFSAVKQTAADESTVVYNKIFTNYTKGNILDHIARSIFPYWTYTTQKYPRLFRLMVRHPALFAGWGRYQKQTELGYTANIKLPFRGTTALQMQPFRGTMLGPILTTLQRRGYPGPEFYDLFPGYTQTFDILNRYGFYQNILFTAGQAIFGMSDPRRRPQFGELLPPTWASLIDGLGRYLPNHTATKVLSEILFPDRFREYITLVNISMRGGVGKEIFNKKILGQELSDEEQALWDESTRHAFGYQLLQEQLPIFRLRPEEQQAFWEAYGQALYDMTGITPEEQENLRRMGYRVADITGGLSTGQQRFLKQLSEDYNWRWHGTSSPLRPTEHQIILAKIDQYYQEIRTARERLVKGPLVDAEGKVYGYSQTELDNQFLSGERKGDDWSRTSAQSSRSFQDFMIWLAQTNQYGGGTKHAIPLTWEARAAFYQENYGLAFTRHVSEEIVDLYFSLQVQRVRNPETGVMYDDWDTYYAQVDALLEMLDPGMREEFNEHLSKWQTPLQKLHREINHRYFRPYNALRKVVLETEFTDKEQKLIYEWQATTDHARRKVIQDMTREDSQDKLVSSYRRAVRNLRLAEREVNPQLDAWLLFWNRTDTIVSGPDGQLFYNELLERYKKPIT